MTSMSRLAAGAAFAALLCGSASAVYAQDVTSSVRGQLSGGSGAAVSNATVTILHAPSGTRAVVSSNSQGIFDARGLRVGGPYTVTVAAPGFETKTLSGVNLAQGDTLRLDFSLSEENAVEELVVTASRNPEADNSGLASTASRESIATTVSVNRDIRDIARQNLLTSANTASDGGLSIAGSNPKMNRLTIDGMSVGDDFGLNSGGFPTRRGPVSLDAIEQLTVQAVPYDVENGDFQGGAIDIVLKSGTNQFHGIGFINYLNDGMTGRNLKGRPVTTAITQDNYGGFLSGPIWKDRAFFAISYEKYKTAEQVTTGPTGAGFPNSFANLPQQTIDQVLNIFSSQYATKFDAGNIPRTTPILDEKYSAKVDVNITEDHRLALTYRYALSEARSKPNATPSVAGLSSNFYLSGEEDYTYVGELNSRWTDQFSTTLRVSYRDYERRQNPDSGQEFAELQICTAAVSTGVPTTCDSPASAIRIGPDEFRHANELETHNLQVQAKATYSVGSHLFKVGVESQNLEIVNLFVAQSDGTYYFDSIADFAAGRANRFQYNNAPSGNPFDAAASFKYQQNSLYLQDIVDVTDELQISAGARFDWFNSNDRPILNPLFAARNGFDNRTTYDGRSILMPRVAFKWDPGSFYKVSGGFGIFSGGVPDVLIATSYSTTGYANAGIQIQRNADGTFVETGNSPLFTQAIGATALNVNRADPRFGYDLPATVTGLVTPAALPPNSQVIALDPSFKVPSAWKFFLNAAFDLPWEFKATADVVVADVRDTLAYRDTRVRALTVGGAQQFTPDGRPRYDGLTITDAQRAALGIGGTNVQTNQDFVVYNEHRGAGWIAGASLSRAWFGRDLYTSIGYVRQKLNEGTSGLRFGTTGGSLYSSQLADAFDSNSDAYGRGYEEVKDRIKVDVSYKHEFIRGAATRITLFGEARSGRPFNVTMGSVGGNRSPVFGVNRSAFQLYVPDFVNDPNPNDLDVGFVTFANAATRDALRAAVARFNLPVGIVPKGFNRNPDVNQLDLQIAQDIPMVFLEGHKFQIRFDIQNVLNLLNSKWGTVEEYGSITGSGQGNNRILDVQCATSTGAFATTGSTTCARYLYSNPSNTALNRTTFNDRSLWYMQVSLRYEF